MKKISVIGPKVSQRSRVRRLERTDNQGNARKVESEHRVKDDDSGKSINNGVSSEEQEQEHEEQQKPTPMQKQCSKPRRTVLVALN